MSAFAAIVARQGGERLPRTLRAMTERWGAEAPHGIALRHFGADGRAAADEAQAHERGAAAGLAHGLLVARDGATLGPHALGDRYWIAGDIRIDAQDALRAALRDAGAPLRGDEDDERLVLHAYAAWGDACVARLRGDFSFALWDAAARTLLCARDGFGIRPLYYADLGDAFVCSNVLAAVRAHPAVGAALHEPAIVSYLQWGFNVDAARTTFEAVRRLPRAKQFVVSATRGLHQEREHWRFPEPAPLRLADEREYVEAYREVLADAVRDRMRVSTLAILLSGGLDSTSLAATVRRVAPGAVLHGFTADLSAHVRDDEARLAGLVADRLGMTHHVRDAWGEPYGQLYDARVETPEPTDAPLRAMARADAAAIAATAAVSFLGEDGDSLFDPPGLLASIDVWGLWSAATGALRYTWQHRRTPHTGLWLRRRLRDLVHPPEPTVPDLVRADVAARTAPQTHAPSSVHPTRPESFAYLASTAWQSLAESVRPASTGAAGEMRFPLTDARVISYVWSIPPIPWCQAKELTRVAFRAELPMEVLRRAKAPVRPSQSTESASALVREMSGWPNRAAAIDQFVDTAKFLAMFHPSAANSVPIIGRVLQLDAWMRHIA